MMIFCWSRVESSNASLKCREQERKWQRNLYYLWSTCNDDILLFRSSDKKVFYLWSRCKALQWWYLLVECWRWVQLTSLPQQSMHPHGHQAQLFTGRRGKNQQKNWFQPWRRLIAKISARVDANHSSSTLHPHVSTREWDLCGWIQSQC